MKETGAKIDYLVGTMIELPRAALRAQSIAEAAEFFSFGTNDLTQTTFGISRDDAASFLETYRQKGIIEHDPFVSLDIDGVGELVRIAAEKGRRDAARHQARHLRRAWRRPGLDPLLRGGRARLCLLLALPRADRAAGGGAGGGEEGIGERRALRVARSDRCVRQACRIPVTTSNRLDFAWLYPICKLGLT